MSPETFAEILSLSGAAAATADGGWRELPPKTLLTLYLARAGVGLNVPSVDAVALKGLAAQARTNKGEIYVFDLSDVFAANVEGRHEPRAKHRPGFG
ncbi:MAG: hypothetical protein ACHREM_30910 [Polyangiales bacterium]